MEQKNKSDNEVLISYRSLTDFILFHITLKQTLKKVCNDESMSGDVVKEFIKTISKDW